ncbi:hypothetical protein X556_0432 [Chlamydia pneumoniae B21]|nr:hypothetical protein X556_0432 [Chlamydia pneumoniae B21]
MCQPALSLIIVSVVAAVLAIVALVCSQSLLSIGLGIALVLVSLILFASAMFMIYKMRQEPKELLIPKKIMELIQEHYPSIVVDFIRDQEVSIYEIHHLISILNKTSVFDKAPVYLQEKLLQFGIEKFKDVHPSKLPNFEEILLQHCPLHWLGRLVYPMVPDVTPGTYGYYWCGPLGLYENAPSLFERRSLLLLKKMSFGEFALLEDGLKKNTWSSSELVQIRQNLFTRYYADKEEVDEAELNADYEQFNSLLHLIFSHKLSWKQVQLFQYMNESGWDWLCDFDSQGEGFQLSRLVGLLHSSWALYEAKEQFYLPEVSLLTWEELIEMQWLSKPAKHGVAKDLCNVFEKHFQRFRQYLGSLESKSKVRKYLLELS